MNMGWLLSREERNYQARIAVWNACKRLAEVRLRAIAFTLENNLDEAGRRCRICKGDLLNFIRRSIRDIRRNDADEYIESLDNFSKALEACRFGDDPDVQFEQLTSIAHILDVDLPRPVHLNYLFRADMGARLQELSDKYSGGRYDFPETA